MKPRPFKYLRPDTVQEALDALAEHGDEARILAGGQSLMAMLNLRLVSPSVLIDINRIAGLGTIEEERESVTIGAGVTQAQLLRWPGLKDHLPFVARVLPWVGHFQTRNRGTVCGSLAHSDPSSELPLALALLEGEVCLQSRRKKRWLKASAFQQGLLQTARTEVEMLTAVRFPKAPGEQAIAFREVARRHGDFAILGTGVIAEGGNLKVGVAGMRDTAYAADLPKDLNASAQADWINAVSWQLGGLEDLHASARYRRDLLRKMLPMLIEEVRACAA